VKHLFSWKDPKPAKTCAIVRYGAIGDMIQTSSLFPWLKEQGFHVTLYCQSGQGYESVKHDPHIDRFIVQERDAVPNQFLGEFWAETRKKYDKWINLCESIEGTLLASPGRANWEWPNEVRAKYMDRNYLEWTHELSGVPAPYRPKFYSTPKEREKARWTAQKWGRRNILWSLAGSSGHKVWPHLDAVLAAIMLEYSDTHVVLVGDDACRILEVGWEKEPRVHCKSGEWTIRESMAFAEVADLIIGTETGLLNAAGSMDAAKIVTLSHSSPEMLTKHWKNFIALQQTKGVGCAKSPCRQLHGGGNTSPWTDCPQEPETGTALCQFHVGPEVMMAAVRAALGVPVAMPKRMAA
jgi:ADP-heptose:LPS heptosyltransferase